MFRFMTYAHTLTSCTLLVCAAGVAANSIESPRIATPDSELNRGNREALASFWQEVARLGISDAARVRRTLASRRDQKGGDKQACWYIRRGQIISSSATRS
jgi:hypothetical protein